MAVRRNPFAALVGLAAVAAAAASVVRESRAARAAAPVVVRRRLSKREAAALHATRADARGKIQSYWNGLAAEDVARLAMAWPAQCTVAGRPQ